MNAARPVRTYCGEEVVAVKADVRILHLAAVLGEEHRACPRTIPHSENIALLQCGAARSGSERPVVRFVAV